MRKSNHYASRPFSQVIIIVDLVKVDNLEYRVAFDASYILKLKKIHTLIKSQRVVEIRQHVSCFEASVPSCESIPTNSR